MDNGMICKLEAEIEEYEKQIKKLEAVIEYLHRDMDSLRMRCKPGIEKYFDRKSYGMIMIVGCNEEVRDANALRAENESLKQRIAELESKETEKPTKINLNDRIKVKLTPFGAEIYYHQYDDLNKKIKENGGTQLEPRMPEIDKDGFTEFTLWHFMELYGKHIGMCKKNVIEPLDIIVVD